MFGQNPSTGSEDNAWKPYFEFQKTAVTMKNKVMVTKKRISPLPLPTMYLCKFDQNPATGSEDNAWKQRCMETKLHGNKAARKQSYGDTGPDTNAAVVNWICTLNKYFLFPLPSVRGT